VHGHQQAVKVGLFDASLLDQCCLKIQERCRDAGLVGTTEFPKGPILPLGTAPVLESGTLKTQHKEFLSGKQAHHGGDKKWSRVKSADGTRCRQRFESPTFEIAPF
jgi:hypothetical protein